MEPTSRREVLPCTFEIGVGIAVGVITECLDIGKSEEGPAAVKTNRFIDTGMHDVSVGRSTPTQLNYNG